MTIQSIHFPKQHYSCDQATAWLQLRYKKYTIMDEDDRYWKFKQCDPARGATYMTHTIEGNVKIVMMD